MHFWLTFIFYNMTFFPMHILGLGGHMRRLYDPTQYDFLKPLQPINRFISVSAFLLFAAQLLFVVNFFWSLFRGPKARTNPWRDNGLEWTGPSPAAARQLRALRRRCTAAPTSTACRGEPGLPPADRKCRRPDPAMTPAAGH